MQCAVRPVHPSLEAPVSSLRRWASIVASGITLAAVITLVGVTGGYGGLGTLGGVGAGAGKGNSLLSYYMSSSGTNMGQSGATQEALAELSFQGSGAQALSLSGACLSCSELVLSNHKPWVASDRLDPEDALTCTQEGSCAEAQRNSAYLSAAATVQAGGGGGLPQQQLAQQDNFDTGHGKWGVPDRMSKEQFAYDVEALDRQQLALNWRRARAFAKFAGSPKSGGATYALASFVPPVDPKGRPVPSWLKFTPTAMSQFQMSTPGATEENQTVEQQLSEVAIGGLKPILTVQPMTQGALAGGAPVMPPPPVCPLKSSCSSCAGAVGCEWCGGAELCMAKCMDLKSITVYTKASVCPASAAAAPAAGKPQAALSDAQNQRQNSMEVKSLVTLSRMGLAGSALLQASEAQDVRIKATALFLPGQTKGGPTLQDTLDPMNREQEAINGRRQMLYFRTETGIHAGEDMADVDNFAKPTLSWSTIGRPWTGWLHWGNDNDGGFLSPAGGQDWDPSVVNPAADGGYGKATRHYIAKHLPATSEIAGGRYSQAGSSPLFGAMDIAKGEQLASVAARVGVAATGARGEYGDMATALGDAAQPVVPTQSAV